MICAQSRDHRVDHRLSEAIAQREVRLQESVAGRTVDEVEHDLRIDVTRELASFDRPIDHAAVLGPHGTDEALAPNLGQLRIALDFGDQSHQGAARHRSLDDFDPGAKGGEEVRAQ